MTDSYEDFKKSVFQLTKIDLNAYKERQMKRRIDSLITKNRFTAYASYVTALKADKVLFDEFVNYLTINVSEFYRNPEQWVILENEIIPELLSKSAGGRLKIWSAACSTGDEPYSLAMMLSRKMPMSNIHIIATDIDRQVLAKANEGIYNEKFMKSLPAEFVKRYFVKCPDGQYKVSEEIKKCIEFKQHNLLKDPYPADCDLIVCRNVLIYFTEEAKDGIYKAFNKSLKTGGYLFVGSTEQIIAPASIGFDTKESFFYRKK